MTLHTAIDLTSLPQLKGGVAFYLVELVRALHRTSADHRFSLVTREEHAGEWPAGDSRFSIVPVALRTRPLRLAWEQVELPRLVRRLAADVLHSPHYTRPLSRLRCASVVGVMDMTFFILPEHHTWAKRHFFARMLRESVRRADRLIAISRSTANDLERWLQVPQSLIDVTPLAVSSAYRPIEDEQVIDGIRRRYGLPDSYVLFVGRLEPRKNLPRLLEAYSKLSDDMPEAPPLVLAGAPGWHSTELERSLRRLGPRAKVIGYVPEEDLPAMYAGALVFVYPSLYEGFGIPVLEALSCGVPVITSNISSMSEVAAGAAELVNPSDASDMTRALAHLLSNGARRQELRELGLQRAASFSWDLTARLTIESYSRTYETWRTRTA